MKKFILGFIFLELFTNLIFSMEERPAENNGNEQKKDLLSKLGDIHQEIQILPLELGIKSELNNTNPIEATLYGVKYINDVTSTNRSWRSKKTTLENRLKQLAKEKFASAYQDLSQEELNKKLDQAINELDYPHKKIPNKLEMGESEIAKLIIAGANPNFIVEINVAGLAHYKDLLLNRIIQYGDINLIKFLIVYGATLNFSNEQGITPLMTTVINTKNLGIEKAKQIIDLLIKQKADINQETKAKTAIFQAFKHDDMEMEVIEILLNNGAKPDEVAIAKLKSNIETMKQKAELFKSLNSKRLQEATAFENNIINLLKKYGYSLSE